MPPSLPSRLPRWLRVLGFFLLIFGGKLWFLHVAGSDLPTWDQWDGEGEAMLRPWLEGWMGPHEIFQAHNEHRLVTTRLYSLGLFAVNGEWDGFVETTTNAAIHAACAVVLLALAARWLKRAWLVAFGALLVLLFTLPFSWENTLFGFQVQFYFLLLFSLGHLGLTLDRDDFSLRWLLGQLSGALAVLSLASGFFSSVAILAVLAHRFVRERRFTAQQLTSAAVAIVFCLAGWQLKTEVPGHAELKAHGAGQFIRSCLDLIAWPGTSFFPWALALFVPAVVFTVHRTRQRETSPDDAVLLGLLIWTLLQCVATAYARGGSGSVLSPRYFDLLTLNVALGFVFLFREFTGRVRAIATTLWIAGIAVGLAQQSRQMWREFVAPNIARQEAQEKNVRDFLQTNDPAHLLNKPWGEVPYPVGEVLVQRLASPLIRDAIPPSVRRSIPLGKKATSAVPADVKPAQRPIAFSSWRLPSGQHWRSEAVTSATLPVLRFTIAGDLGHDGRIVIKNANKTVPVMPDSVPGARWKTVNVENPGGAWWIEADTAETGKWFAFTEPVEVGRWSFVAEKLLKHFLVVIVAGVVCLLLGSWPLARAPRG